MKRGNYFCSRNIWKETEEFTFYIIHNLQNQNKDKDIKDELTEHLCIP